MIVVEALTYTYPGAATPVLQNVDLHVPAGQFCGLVGANEAGKSTLCYALSGFIPHFYHGVLEGKVVVAGRDIPQTPLAQLAGELGLVFQNPFNQITGARFTLREEVAFGLENLGVPRAKMIARVDQALELMGLADLAERSPFALSGGQQQRLAIASVVVMHPKVLILDEPTSQLDPLGTKEVFSALRDLVTAGGITVVLVTHKLEWLAAFADRVVMLNDGQVVADGDPGDVLVSPDLARFGVGQTRYSQAAHLAQSRKLVSGIASLPVTLEQAIRFFT